LEPHNHANIPAGRYRADVGKGFLPGPMEPTVVAAADKPRRIFAHHFDREGLSTAAAEQWRAPRKRQDVRSHRSVL
jgi:hypothetical protein